MDENQIQEAEHIIRWAQTVRRQVLRQYNKIINDDQVPDDMPNYVQFPMENTVLKLQDLISSAGMLEVGMQCYRRELLREEARRDAESAETK